MKNLGDHLRRWGDDFATFTVEVIYDRRSDFRARLWGGFLLLLSFLFQTLSVLRYKLYQQRVLRADHLGCLVVVVGNLTVGGTGKTPVVEKLARSLQEGGRKVAILSRGYKSKKEPMLSKAWRWMTHKEPAKPRIVSDGEQILETSLTAGDEPYMLARNLPGVVVITDKDRVKAGNFAIRHFKVDTLILDDGFQYFQLKDHLQLLLIDTSNPFGNGHLLPRGILREPVRHLKRASHIMLTKSDGAPDPAILERIERHRPKTEWMECTHAPQYLMAVNGDRRQELSYLSGKRVAALSAIAAPESFENFLSKYGAEVVEQFRFLDHHRFRDDELQQLGEDARKAGIDILVTTEKDAVRIPDSFVPGIEFYYLRVEIEMIAGVKDFDEAVRRICFGKDRRRL